MLTVSNTSTGETIYFKNLERRPEKELLKEIISTMKSKGCDIKNEKDLPYCDLYEGSYKNINFDIVYDYDYGTYISLNDDGSESRKEIEGLFSEEEKNAG